MRPVGKRCKRGKEIFKAHNNREHQDLYKEQGNHARTTEEIIDSRLLLLPLHLIYDILDWLPIYDIFKCKHVCKTFAKILSDPCFSQHYFAKASRDDYSLITHDVSDPYKIFLTPLPDLDKKSSTIDHYHANRISWQLIPSAFVPKKKKSSLKASLVGFCNGLLCLRYFDPRDRLVQFCVCNPILGEFTTLPQPRRIANEHGGFGFCPKTKQYKVLRFNLWHRVCDILTLGRDDYWRRLGDFPPLLDSEGDADSSYKGNLHWFDRRCSFEQRICSFNLETERYSYISLPTCLNNDFSHIGTLNGLFCVSFTTYPGRVEAYVMEDYEVKESWIKRISVYIGGYFGCSGLYLFSSTIKLLDNGVLVFRCMNHLVYCYDTRKGSSPPILLEGYQRRSILSLVSL